MQPVYMQPVYYAPQPTYAAPMVQPATDTVYFSLNSASLSAESRATLQRQIEWLRMNPQPSIVIEGHADDRGSEAYNLALGERRARTVRDFLVRNGVPAQMIAVTSYGKDRPAVLGTDEFSRSRNRRVVTAGG